MHLFAQSVQECTTACGAVLYDLEAHMYVRNVCSVTQKHLTLSLARPNTGQPTRRT